MNREEARKAAEVMMAYADGKTIECRFKNDYDRWYEAILVNGVLDFDWNLIDYRIKPEPTYRPFKDKEECWNEMMKHQPFGWIIDKHCNIYQCIVAINDICPYFSSGNGDDFKHLLECVTFADGAPFGIAETIDRMK